MKKNFLKQIDVITYVNYFMSVMTNVRAFVFRAILFSINLCLSYNYSLTLAAGTVQEVIRHSTHAPQIAVNSKQLIHTPWRRAFSPIAGERFGAQKSFISHWNRHIISFPTT